MAVYHNDDELLYQWKNGNETAFENLYQRHLKELLIITTARVADFETARDIVQNAFITFHTKKDKMLSNPLLYLKQILKYKILEYYRSLPNRKFVPLTAIPPLAHCQFGEIEEHINEKETKIHIAKTLLDMPTQRRRVFLLSREAHLSNKEIANELNISVKTVESHMTQALALLRKKLKIFLFLCLMIIIPVILIFMAIYHQNQHLG